MSSEFLIAFKKIIRECDYDNTYKMAWGKALVEFSYHNKIKDETVKILFKDIAEKVLKYYWNQTIFFNLIQGSNIKKPPLIVQKTKSLIEKYYEYIGSNKPDLFEKIEEILKKPPLFKEYETTIKGITKDLKKDVSYRFPKNKDFSPTTIYVYNMNNEYLIMKQENIELLKENHQDLFDLINYRWSLILESFNSSPRINKKVRIIDERKIIRKSLMNFKPFLDLENPNHICHICGKPISNSTISIDHVIPWSYLYSDDIWNLVYVCKNCNSSKNAKIPSESNIKKLKERNVQLLYSLKDKRITGKIVDELEIAVEKDYVEKFWIGSKG